MLMGPSWNSCLMRSVTSLVSVAMVCEGTDLVVMSIRDRCLIMILEAIK
jgi:hypothetical protein